MTTEIKKMQVSAILTVAMIDRLGDLSEHYETPEELAEYIESHVDGLDLDEIINKCHCSDLYIGYEWENDYFYYADKDDNYVSSLPELK